MVTSCVAYQCSYRHKKGSNISMFRFPKAAKRRRLWIIAIRRENWTPTSSSRICGKHFQKGKPSLDEDHPDYVPNVFSFSKVTKSAELYEKRKKAIEKRQNVKTTFQVNRAAEALMIMANNSTKLAEKNTAAESLLLLRQGSSNFPGGNTAPNSLLLSGQGSSNFSGENTAANSSFLSDQGSSSFPGENAATNSFFLTGQDHETESIDEVSLTGCEERLPEPPNLESLVKGIVEKVSSLEGENLELKNVIQSMHKEMILLRAERNILHQTAISLKPTEIILNNEKYFKFYTGLSSITQFKWLLEVLENEINSVYLSKDTQLLIVLMRIKQNLLSSDIACRFQVSLTTIRRIFDTWIPLLARKLNALIYWPTKKSLKKYCPRSFKHTEYKDTVCIIDCTEIQIEKPSNLKAQSQLWSTYKNFHSIKVLVATTPSGMISFISNAWVGRTSDKEITLNSGFMDKICSGDLILADRGFILDEHFTAKGAKLVVPSFTRGKKQLSKQEIIYSKKVANVRIHVERVIKQIKRFHILKHTIPLNFVKHIDNIIIICAGLSNLTPSVIP